MIPTLNISTNYKGYLKVDANDPKLAEVYADNTANPFDLIENQGLIVCDEDGGSYEYRWKHGKLERVVRKPVESAHLGKIRAKNAEQALAIDMLMDPSITVKVMTGGFGTGKAQPNDTIIPTPDGYKELGDIKPGDFVFNRSGKPVKVLSVHPQGKIDNYKVTLGDGRVTYCNDMHLWSTLTSKGNLITRTLKDMMRTGLKCSDGLYRYHIPCNKAVEYEEKEYEVDPYAVGVMIGNGCCLEKQFTISSAEESVVAEVARLIDARRYKRNSDKNYSWVFEAKDENKLPRCKNFQTRCIVPESVRCCSGEKRIPEAYKYGSIEQRFALMQGLMDTDGSVSSPKERVSYSTTSEGLAKDIQEVLWSLGFLVRINKDSRTKYRSGACYTLRISNTLEEKLKLFRCSKKKSRLENASDTEYRRKNNVAIISAERVGMEEMTCIYVDDPEHLYLTENFIVTHNTMLGCACAMSLIQQGKYDKILWVRNNIEVKDSNPIGYLKGGYMDKMIVWAMPLADHVGGREALEQMIERDQLEVEHLGFLRGRDIKNSIIFCSEAEHLTRQHVQLLLGRVSEGSVLLLEGDCSQIDQRAFEQDNGLEAAIDRLKGNPLFAYVHLNESVRSETAKLADLLNK